MIVLVDFGSQTAHLIARRIRDFGIPVEICTPEDAITYIKKKNPRGIILSGGPSCVYDLHAPTIDKKVFEMEIPILGICYGQQLFAHLLGGEVVKDTVREDGPATLMLNNSSPLFESVSPHSRIWMSHGDTVVKPPEGFIFIAESETIAAAAMQNEKKKMYGVQFHPEVEHTEHGNVILKNFVEKICGMTLGTATIEVKEIIDQIRETVKDVQAIAAVSGGLDSTVAATLVARAIGKKLIPVHVDSGLMREGTTEQVRLYFQTKLGVEPIILYKQKEFLEALRGVTEPEQKRKIIGKLYVELFDEECKKHKNVQFLVQGTIYSDVIESKGSKHAANIKSHHNVGGLPVDMKLRLIEPIRELYTDQVRSIAKDLDVPEEFITQQPHPGPGYAIRILGEVTKERLEIMHQADQIVISEMEKSGWYKKVLHSFPILTGISSTSVKGDGRVYGEVVALRILTSKDRMSADWVKIPYEVLQRITSRITNEIPHVSRVVYDITTKPPATMEWE